VGPRAGLDITETILVPVGIPTPTAQPVVRRLPTELSRFRIVLIEFNKSSISRIIN
jgi:hypothetical protein